MAPGTLYKMIDADENVRRLRGPSIPEANETTGAVLVIALAVFIGVAVAITIIGRHFG